VFIVYSLFILPFFFFFFILFKIIFLRLLSFFIPVRVFISLLILVGERILLVGGVVGALHVHTVVAATSYIPTNVGVLISHVGLVVVLLLLLDRRDSISGRLPMFIHGP